MNTCPHCGAAFAKPNATALHERVCLRKPGMEELIRRCLEDPDHPGTAVTTRVYAVRASLVGAPSDETLINAFGGWPQVCARFGLVRGTRRGTSESVRRDREAVAIAETEAALEADARLREAWRDRGLEVCRVRQVRGGVAYELR